MRVQAVLPPGAKIMFIGEAPGEQEELLGTPFVGGAGQELTEMIGDAFVPIAERTGISRNARLALYHAARNACAITNVFDERPANNELKNWAMPKKEWTAKCKSMGVSIPAFGTSLYLDPAVCVPALARLEAEVNKVRPNIIVCLGNTALVAVSGKSGIGAVRGTVLQSKLGPKFLATYHPAAVLRDWSLRTIVISDLEKAKYESEFPDIRRRPRTIYVPETFDDLLWFEDRFLKHAPSVTFDVETERGQITTIAFAPSPDIAIVIPIWDDRKPDYCYWTEADEIKVIFWIRRLLMSEKQKRAQNGLYDIQYVGLCFASPTINYADDTMILHHTVYSQMPKGLAFLASVYINEINWKALNPRAKDKMKRDE